MVFWFLGGRSWAFLPGSGSLKILSEFKKHHCGPLVCTCVPAATTTGRVMSPRRSATR